MHRADQGLGNVYVGTARRGDVGPVWWFDGDHTLFFFAKSLSGDIVRTSTDSGATWSRARLIQPEVEIGNMPLRTREGFLVLPLDRNKIGLCPSADFRLEPSELRAIGFAPRIPA